MSIQSLLNQTGTIEHKGEGSDRHGKPSFGVGKSVRMRFEKTTKTIATANREREPINGRVFVLPNTEVEKGDRLTYLGTVYRVMTADPIVVGAGGVHHLELLVQEWTYGS